MNRRNAAHFAALFGLCGVLVLPAVAEQVSVTGRFPPGAVTSPELAQQALDAVQAERAEVHARFTREEAACYDNFFVNHCIDEAKERRRQALEPLQAIELEAEHFLRRQRALGRDREMVERQQGAAERAEQAASIVPPPPRAPREAPLPPNDPPKPPKEPRAALTPEQEQAEARERAENEAAYARKVQAAKERREAVARRKAEKEKRTGGARAEAAQPAPEK